MTKLFAAALLALFAVSLLGCELIAPQREQVTGKLVVDPGPDPSIADLAATEAAAGRYAELASSRPVVVSVIDDLGLDESSESLSSRYSVTASRDDLVLTIEVRDEDPEAARVLAVTLGDEMIRRVNDELAAEAHDGSGSLAERISEELQERVNEPLQDLPGGSTPPSIVRCELARLEPPAAPEPTQPPDRRRERSGSHQRLEPPDERAGPEGQPHRGALEASAALPVRPSPFRRPGRAVRRPGG